MLEQECSFERLTDEVYAESLAGHINHCKSRGILVRKEDIQYVRLAAYEDTGLAPEDASKMQFNQAYAVDLGIADHYKNIGVSMTRLDELAAADKAGKVIILSDGDYTDADGEKALKRAMQHESYTNNAVTRFTSDAIAEKLCPDVRKKMVVHTPLGSIVAEASTDSDNPGIWLSLHRDSKGYEPSLALVEYTRTTADRSEPVLVTRVWADVLDDEHTDQVIHRNLDKPFEEVPE